jgi:hypothetical protein
VSWSDTKGNNFAVSFHSTKAVLLVQKPNSLPVLTLSYTFWFVYNFMHIYQTTWHHIPEIVLFILTVANTSNPTYYGVKILWFVHQCQTLPSQLQDNIALSMVATKWFYGS